MKHHFKIIVVRAVLLSPIYKFKPTYFSVVSHIELWT